MCHLLKVGTELSSGNTLNSFTPGFLQMSATSLWFPQKHFFFEFALSIFLRALKKQKKRNTTWIDFKQFGISTKN